MIRSGDVAPAPTARVEACVVEDAPGAKRPATWRVAKGETLRSIARKAYGDERFGDEIRLANAGRVSRDGAVAPGTLLVLPTNVR